MDPGPSEWQRKALTAVQSEKADALKELLEERVSKKNEAAYSIDDLYDDSGRSLLMLCAESKAGVAEHRRCLELLLDHSADVNGTDKSNNHTPLRYAAFRGSAMAVEVLQARGATVDLRSRVDNETALIVASQKGQTDVVRLLLTVGKADTDAQGKNGNTPLINAAGGGFTESVQLFLDHNAAVNVSNNDGASALSEACRNGHSECVRLLLEKGAEVEVQVENDETCLLLASKHGHTRSVELLLDADADIEAENDDDETSLLLAAGRGHSACVELLLRRFADIQATDDCGRTALVRSTLNNHSNTVLALLRAGADPNVPDEDGEAPLLLAARSSAPSAVLLQHLLEHGAAVDTQSTRTRGTTALMCVCEARERGVVSAEAVEVLLDHGASVVSTNVHGLTPLLVACQGLRSSAGGEVPPDRVSTVKRIIQTLVQHGAASVVGKGSQSNSASSGNTNNNTSGRRGSANNNSSRVQRMSKTDFQASLKQSLQDMGEGAPDSSNVSDMVEFISDNCQRLSIWSGYVVYTHVMRACM